MANFISVLTGNVNDGGTFGNNSPGVKGTDWPGLAGDTFTASVGDTVTYNVSETNELGQIDVVGKLSFDDAADRLLTLGNANLNIANGGELEIGTSGSNFAAAQTAEILWNTTSDAAKGIVVADGGQLTVYGASDYCTVYEDTLADDVENTDGDAVIKTVTDMSGDWHVGDELTIKVENAGDTSSYKDAVKRGVIQSFDGGDGTLITLDINITAAADVGDTWTSPVVNVSRNVQFGKLNADVACGDGSTHYNTNRPQIVDSNADGNNNCVFSYTMVTGFYAISSDYDFQFLNSVLRNGRFGFAYGTGHIVSGSVYSNTQGIYRGTGHIVSSSVYSNTQGIYRGTGHIVSGNVYSNTYGIYYGTRHTVSGNVHSNAYGTHYGARHIISGNVHSNSRGISYGTGHTVSGNVYSNYSGFSGGVGHVISGDVYDNTRGFSGGTGHTISGRIGYDNGDVSQPNTTDFYTDGYCECKLLNVKLPLAGLSMSRDVDGYVTRIMCEHHNRVENAHKTYDNNGDVIKVACDGGGDRPSEDPDGDNADCIELSNIQSGCSSANPLEAWGQHQVQIWATASVSLTYTFKVQTTYAGITAGNLKLTANYLDEGSGGHLGEETDAPAINQRTATTDWTQTLAVTVNPTQTGWVDFMIELQEYESNNEVWIWSEVEIS